MKYALVNGEYQEAQPELSGKCKCCGSSTIPKCGKLKIWHWAHIGKRMCDQWWENETEWHRAWKGQFPKEWQEFIQHAESGEKHIADVKTAQGYVIEFQHSYIKTEERQAREDFYKKMLWVVDGTRRSRDKDAFMDAWKYSHPIDGRVELRRLLGLGGKCALLQDWGGSSVPVFFDFSGEVLWGILPKTKEEKMHVCSIKRDVLIASLQPILQANSFEVILKGWDNLIENEEIYVRWLARGKGPVFP